MGASLTSYTGLTVKIDGAVQVLDGSSQITFEPATEAYVLTVEYQGLQLYNQHPPGSPVSVPGVVKLSTSACGIYTLSVAFNGESKTVTCSSETGVLYLKQATGAETLSITSAQY